MNYITKISLNYKWFLKYFWFYIDDMTVHLQSENGILGLGPFPTKDEVNLINE